MPKRSGRGSVGENWKGAPGPGPVPVKNASKSLSPVTPLQKQPEVQKEPDRSEPEWKELIERIKASEDFHETDKSELLDFFWEHRHELLKDKNIESDFYGEDITLPDFDANRSRVALAELREKLASYFATEKHEKWRCTLPNAKRAGGYRLIFTLARKPSTATENFWNVHLNSDLVPVVICGCHLFFFDTQINQIIRYYDFNPPFAMAKDKIIEALKLAHPECDTSSLDPWHDVYLATGDVHAHDSLVQWFYDKDKILIKRKTSRHVTEDEVHRQNPILMGRPQTNPLIETLLGTPPQVSKFAFRIHDVKGTIKVTNIDPKTIPELSEFPISADGVVGPITDTGKVFGIVTRFPNPGGRGYITIIACGHYAMVNARIVEAMTSEVHAKEMLGRMNWPIREALPDSFEILFTVDLTRGGLQGEGFPQLVTWRRC
jgi:hypothetical protein